MTVTMNAADSVQAVKEELIKHLGGEYTIPDLDDVAKYSQAKCAQLADELKDKGLITTTIASFVQMSLLEKREALMKILKDLVGPPVDDDPILEFASQIEKVNTRAEIEEMVKEFDEVRHFGQFQLGGVIAVAHELFNKPNSEFEGYKNFGEYIVTVLGIGYHKAMRLEGIYRKLRYLGVPWSAFGNIGWTKVLALVDVVTIDNVKDLVEKAKVMNLHALKDYVEAEKAKIGAGQNPKTLFTQSVKLHADQHQLWLDSIEKAKEETGTESKGVAVEAICQHYMGGGIAFSDWKQALLYFRKHVTATEFAMAVISNVEELCPELVIDVNIGKAPTEGSTSEEKANAA